MTEQQPKPVISDLVAVAVGAAARICARYEFTAEQSAELMRVAWYVVQDKTPAPQQTRELFDLTPETDHA